MFLTYVEEMPYVWKTLLLYCAMLICAFSESWGDDLLQKAHEKEQNDVWSLSKYLVCGKADTV